MFGRISSRSEASADPNKMTTVDPDKPESIEELESLLQAATYNAKFAFASSLPSRQVG